MIIRTLVRYRRVLLLALTLSVSFLLLTLQVRRDPAERTGLTEVTKRLLLLPLSPLLSATSAMTSAATSLWANYVDLRGLRQENRDLQAEVNRLRAELLAREEAVRENARLTALLRLQQDTLSGGTATLTPARIIGKDATIWFRTLLINKGSRHGIVRNMPVISPEGLVGRVIEVTPFSARVQLITDLVSSVGAVIQRNRVIGVVTGRVESALEMRYVPLTADVIVGDRVITSGMGGVFPKGIVIGTVSAVRTPVGALFAEVEVEPAAPFSHLEEVVARREP